MNRAEQLLAWCDEADASGVRTIMSPTSTVRSVLDQLSQVERENEELRAAGSSVSARRALQGVMGLLETAKAAALFTKPQTGRVVVNVEKLEVELEKLRAALEALSKADAILAHRPVQGEGEVLADHLEGMASFIEECTQGASSIYGSAAEDVAALTAGAAAIRALAVPSLPIEGGVGASCTDLLGEGLRPFASDRSCQSEGGA